ncbi:hypothetical protein D9758_017807 [Tetrapyrgos nigripes]|uniref:Uncharacterized protein n=1 Tax=Tetrapyrgos nigripes TaxID=182062 RepID=A0A8H5B7B0_9AGAR|nr:hypothetical protein D9758_017807 [Tetrapyrgos nigripes]
MPRQRQRIWGRMDQPTTNMRSAPEGQKILHTGPRFALSIMTATKEFELIVAFSGNIAANVHAVLYPSFKPREHVRAAVFVLLLTQSIADISTAAALVIQLYNLTTLSREAERQVIFIPSIAMQ